MKAYAILDGGGVKGAALAGCLKAAQDAGIQFVGYGGTSAGSIVALLAAVGYTGDELKDVLLRELKLGTILADVRPKLAEMAEIRELLSDPGVKTLWKLRKYKPSLQQLSKNYGFVDGALLKQEIFNLVRKKIKDIDETFTFRDLKDKGCKPLKIVASDLGGRRPAIYSDAPYTSGPRREEVNGPVLEAVRASMSYPFIFTPVPVADRFVVDGGLCSSLPVFLFDEERRLDRKPLLAFDLVTNAPARSQGYNFGHFCSDMLDTALEAGDYLRRRADFFSNVYHVRVNVPEGVRTLDFDLPANALEALFNQGIADTSTFLNRELTPWKQAQNAVQRVQALHAPPQDVTFPLEQFAKQLERETGMTDVRAQVMLPIGDGKRIVAYQFNMDNDPDQSLELAEDGGATGRAWTTQDPTIADLEDAARERNYETKWKMTRAQQAAVRKDRKAMICAPIFHPQTLGERTGHNPQSLIGVLSADTNSSLRDMMWKEENKLNKLTDRGERAVLITVRWSSTLSWILR